MPNVETTIWISADLEKVYAVAQDNAAFPEFMEDVLRVEIVERDGPRVVSDWVGVISAFNVKVKWRQEDVWDDDAKKCSFRQIAGDYDEMSGHWQFVTEDGGTRFNSSVSYEYRVPGLGPLVAKVVHSLVVKNLEGVLAAIKTRCEG